MAIYESGSVLATKYKGAPRKHRKRLREAETRRGRRLVITKPLSLEELNRETFFYLLACWSLVNWWT